MKVVTRFKLVTHQLLAVHAILTINMVSLRTGEVSDSLMNWTFSPTGKWRNPFIILKLLMHSHRYRNIAFSNRCADRRI